MYGNKQTIAEVLEKLGRSDKKKETTDKKQSAIKVQNKRKLLHDNYQSETQTSRTVVKKFWKDINKDKKAGYIKKEERKKLPLSIQILIDYRANRPLHKIAKEYKITEERIFQILNGEDED